MGTDCNTVIRCKIHSAADDMGLTLVCVWLQQMFFGFSEPWNAICLFRLCTFFPSILSFLVKVITWITHRHWLHITLTFEPSDAESLQHKHRFKCYTDAQPLGVKWKRSITISRSFEARTPCLFKKALNVCHYYQYSSYSVLHHAAFSSQDVTFGNVVSEVRQSVFFVLQLICSMLQGKYIDCIYSMSIVE